MLPNTRQNNWIVKTRRRQNRDSEFIYENQVDDMNLHVVRRTYARMVEAERKDIGNCLSLNRWAKGYILEDKDILFARSGATVGKTFMYNQHYGICAFAGYLIKASIDIYNSPKFIHYYTLTHSYEEWKKQIFIQATIQNIGADRYAQFTLPIPSIEEQQQIADYLDTKCSEIDEMTSIKQQKIEQLKEYKKSIIYEYVTGKRQII